MRRRRAGRGLVHMVLLAAFVDLACSDDRGASAPAPVSPDAAIPDAPPAGTSMVMKVPIDQPPLDLEAINQACQQYSAALCAKLAACAPRTFARDHGTVARCEMNTARTCRDTMTLPGQIMTPASLSSCTRGVEMFTCQTRPSVPPACPMGRGDLQEGNPCRQTAQCKRTLYCRVAPGADCGLCHPPLPAGAECTVTDQCEAPSRCVTSIGSMGQCLGAAKMRGQSCGPFDQCEPGTTCAAGKCVDPPMPPQMPPPAPMGPANLGEDCSRVSCDSRQDGIYCNRLTNTCEPMLPLAMPGQPCGTLVDGSTGTISCPAGFSCVNKQGLTRTCEPDLAVGEPCRSVANASRCVPPAVCFEGKCQEREIACR